MRWLFFVFIIVSQTAYTQSKISLELHNYLSSKEGRETQTKPLSVLIEGDDNEVIAFLNQIGTVHQYSIKNIHSATLTTSQIQELAKIEGVNSIVGATKGQFLNDSMRIRNHVLPLHNATDGIERPFKGKDVIIGIIDTGIDFRHPDFLDDEGNNRVIAIWDQEADGTAPSGFNYGHFCDYESIQDGTCTSIDTNSYRPHGTHVAAVAAANDVTHNGLYSGMAPHSYLIGVAIDFNNFGTSIVDGAKFIFDIANEMNMPCVINLSAGSYINSKDGNDIYSRALDELITAKEGRAFVNATGNSARYFMHLNRHNIPQQFSYFKRINRANGVLFYLFADAAEFSDLTFQFKVDHASSYETLAESRTYKFNEFQLNSEGYYEFKDTLLNSALDTLGIVELLAEEINGVITMQHYIQTDNPSHLWQWNVSGDGMFDVYSTSRAGTSNIVRSTALTNHPNLSAYANPDNDQSMVGLFNASDKVISVANYGNSVKWVDWRGRNQNLYRDQTPDAIAASSSFGPSRDGKQKPDIASPGAYTMAAYGLNRLQTFRNNGQSYRVAQDGMHYASNGSSNAAPSVTGAIALLFEQYPNLTWEEVKQTLHTTAKRDEFTGDAVNYRWGYGKLDAYKAFTEPIIFGCTIEEAENYNSQATEDDGSCIILGCTNPESFNYNPSATEDDNSCLIPNEGENFYFEIIPNPIQEEATLAIGLPENIEAASVSIYNINGQLITEQPINNRVEYYQLSKEELNFPAGLYIAVLRGNNRLLKELKFVKQ